VTKPVPVEIRSSEFSPMQMLRRVLGSAFGIFTTAFIVIVFVIFMLVERDDLRNRVIRLMGMRKPNFASQLLDDTGRRVTRYLMMQFIVNVSYGILVGVGLLFIGVPNPLLWGHLLPCSGTSRMPVLGLRHPCRSPWRWRLIRIGPSRCWWWDYSWRWKSLWPM